MDEYESPEASGEDEPTPFSPSGKPKSYWDSDEALESLKMEKTVNPTETDSQLAKRLFEEQAPQAATSIIHLALHATNENTRLNAAKYVTDRVLGKVGDGEADESTPLEQLLRDMHNTVEQYANNPQQD